MDKTRELTIDGKTIHARLGELMKLDELIETDKINELLDLIDDIIIDNIIDNNDEPNEYGIKIQRI